VTLEFYRLLFRFRSAGTIYFPPHKSGNILRGAFGHLFRKSVCAPGCRDASSCDLRRSCPYARVFEPKAARGEGPSGLADWPRPFVFRAAHLDGRRIGPGEEFHFIVHLFDVRDPAVAYFVLAFAELAREGIGPGRGRAELISVEQLDGEGTTAGRIHESETRQLRPLSAAVAVDLNDTPRRLTHARIRFVTPTELKSEHQLAERPEFGILFRRLRDRISTLRRLYGAGPLQVDFGAMGERSDAVRMTRCELQWTEVDRVSSRTGERHPLGGCVGEVEYEGELAEFAPYLKLGQWVGAGRQTVWGKGELAVALEE
jgi:hypothetical protein